jgi:hypothetical protein
MEAQLQGGMSNEELRAALKTKLPNVEPGDRDLSMFALGVESASPASPQGLPATDAGYPPLPDAASTAYISGPQGGEYRPLANSYEPDCAMFSPKQMHAYLDADRALRSDALVKALEALLPFESIHEPPVGFKHLGTTAKLTVSEIRKGRAAIASLRSLHPGAASEWVRPGSALEAVDQLIAADAAAIKKD